MTRLLLILGAVNGMARCAHYTPPDTDPNSDWKTVRSEHFILYTDAGPRTYRPILDKLEDVHAALMRAFFPGRHVGGIEVMVFAYDGHFQELVGDLGGVFVDGLRPEGLLIVREGSDAEELAAHELAHRFIKATMKVRPPVWFNEGFASYVETVLVEDEVVKFGRANLHFAGPLANGQMVPLADLMKAQHAGFHGDWERSHYATSWVFVHYLLHGADGTLRERLEVLLQAFANPPPGPDAQAVIMNDTFADITLPELDRRIRDYGVEELGRKMSIRARAYPMTRRERLEPSIGPVDRDLVRAICAALRKQGPVRRN